MRRSVLYQLGRGFAMGAADIVPGVSGGTIALLLGIYERLVATVRDGAAALGRLVRGDLRGMWDQIKAIDWLFLVPLLAGILTAVLALASVIETQLEENAEAMAGIFFGLVAASVVVTWSLLKVRTPAHLLVMVVVGASLFVLLGFQSGPVADPSPLAYFGAGAIAICAMILPGISGSFLLLTLGMYSAVIGTIDDRDIASLAIFAAGAVVGLALFSTLLSWMLERAHDWVMAALIGLMLGSLRVLWPWPNGVGIVSSDEEEVISGTGLEWPAGDEWLAPVVLAIVAFVAVLGLSALARRSTSEPAQPAPTT